MSRPPSPPSSPRSSPRSTPRLPRELLLMIAEEVGANVAAPNQPNKAMSYDEWFKIIRSVFRLRQADSFFRFDCAMKLQAWAPWMPDLSHLRRTTNPPSWAVKSLAQPLRYTYVLPLPGGAITLWSPFHGLEELPKPAVGHLMLNYFLLEVFASSSMLAMASSHLGISHLFSARPERLLDAITRYVEQYDRANAVPDDDNTLERFMRSWPCDTVRYITLLMGNAECPGWTWGHSINMPKYSNDFTSGRSLIIPNRSSQSRAAELLVAMFPRLERVNIVRYPLVDEIKEAWVGRRPVFRGKPETADGMYVYPLLSGRSAKSIKFGAIPKLMKNLDNDFLGHVQRVIDKRKNRREKSEKSEKQ